MKSFTVEIDTDGATEINLKGYEERSPELAAIVEAATGGTVTAKKWNPGNHAHVVAGRKVFHSH
jgi:hypothetical protein